MGSVGTSSILVGICGGLVALTATRSSVFAGLRGIFSMWLGELSEGRFRGSVAFSVLSEMAKELATCPYCASHWACAGLSAIWIATHHTAYWGEFIFRWLLSTAVAVTWAGSLVRFIGWPKH